MIDLDCSSEHICEVIERYVRSDRELFSLWRVFVIKEAYKCHFCDIYLFVMDANITLETMKILECG